MKIGKTIFGLKWLDAELEINCYPRMSQMY